jgi:hypothetical protein
MKSVSKYLAVVLLVILFLFFQQAYGQCPMCKTSLEEARKNGTQVGNTLNMGILYLLALPYSIAMVFGIIWYRNTRMAKK